MWLPYSLLLFVIFDVEAKIQHYKITKNSVCELKYAETSDTEVIF